MENDKIVGNADEAADKILNRQPGNQHRPPPVPINSQATALPYPLDRDNKFCEPEVSQMFNVVSFHSNPFSAALRESSRAGSGIRKIAASADSETAGLPGPGDPKPVGGTADAVQLSSLLCSAGDPTPSVFEPSLQSKIPVPTAAALGPLTFTTNAGTTVSTSSTGALLEFAPEVEASPERKESSRDKRLFSQMQQLTMAMLQMHQLTMAMLPHAVVAIALSSATR